MKRTLCLLLAGLILLPILASCGKTAGQAADPTEPTASAAGETAGEQTEVAEASYVLPKEQYDGYVFRIIARVPYDSAWTIAKYNEVEVESENGDVLNDAIYSRNSQAEELLDIGIRHISAGVSGFDASTAALKSILAGDDAFDAMMINGSTLPAILSSRSALDLTEIGAMDISLPWWDANSVADLSFGGRLWGVAGDMCLMTMGAIITLMFNKVILENLGEEMPYEMVRKGTWTVDRLNELSALAARDLDGNGGFDENDCFGYAAYAGVLQTALTESGCPISTKDKNDLPSLTLNSARTDSVINTWLELLHREGNFYASDFSSKVKDVPFDLMNPMFCDNRILFYRQQLLGALNLRAMEADYGIIPSPKFDEAQERYYSCVHYYWSSFVMIPVTQPDADRCASILNVIGYYSREYIRPAFFDTTVSAKVARDDDTLDMLDIIADSRTYEVARIFDWGSITSLLNTMESGTENTFASQWASNADKAQAALDASIALYGE